MLSVLAFKRSLSAGILDGDSGEISLGGSRLNRFMKQVEQVAGNMGQSEAVTPAEEAGHQATEEAAAAVAEAPAAEQHPGGGGGAKPAEATIAATDRTEAVFSREPVAASDPWHSLVQIGAQFIGALAAAQAPEAAPHPWIERDQATGAPHLRMPLPPPQVARQLADLLAALADNLRGSAA